MDGNSGRMKVKEIYDFREELRVSNEQIALMKQVCAGTYQVKEQRDKQGLQDLPSDGRRDRC